MTSLFTGAALISFAAVFVRLAHVAPDTSAFYRMIFGALALMLVFWRDGCLRRVNLRMVGYSFVCAIFFALDLMCWHRAIHHVGPGLATLLGNFQVFALAGVSLLFLGERPRWLFFLALVPAFVGLYLMVGVQWHSAGTSYRAGVGWGLMTAVFYAGYVIALKLSIPRLGEACRRAFMTCVPAATALVLGVWMLATGKSFAVPLGMDLFWLVCLGVLCQAGGWLFISKGMEGLSAALVGLGLLLQPALSYVWDVLFFGKPVGPTEAVGALLALGGIYLGTLGAKPK